MTVLVKIMLTVVLFDPRSIDAFTLPKSIAAHSTSLILVALLVWLVARHGRSVLVWSPLNVGVGALLLAFALATPFAQDRTVAVFGVYRRYLGLTQMLDNGLLYLAITLLFRDRKSLRLLTVVSIGVAVPTLAYALVQRLGLDPFHYRQASTQIPISFMGNPDLAGAFVAIIGVTALGLAFLLGGPAKTWYRIALAAVGVACMGILYATGVRAGVLAIGAGWLAVLVLTMRLPDRPRHRASLALAPVPFLALGILLSPIRSKLDPSYLRNDLSVISRLDIWQAAARVITAHPVLGVGPDNFAAAYPALRTHASIRTAELQNSTHDVWLYMGVSAGIIGIAAFAFLVVLALDAGVRAAGRGDPRAFALVPLAAYLGQSLVNVNEIVVDWTFWVALGVLASASAVPVAFPRGRSVPRQATAVGAIGLAIAATLIISNVVPRISVGESLFASGVYSTVGYGQIAVDQGAAAVRTDPRRGENWSGYGASLDQDRHSTAAVVAFAEAARLEPWQPLSWMNLAAVWGRVGNAAAAYSSARRIPVVDPFDGSGRELLSTLAYDEGNYSESATQGEAALAYETDPQEPAYFITISAYTHLKDLSRAEELARQATAKFPTARLRLLYAAILADEGKKPEAIDVLDALLKEQPQNADAQALKNALLKGG